MKSAGLKLVTIIVVGYFCFVAGQIFSLQEPEETASLETITADAQDALHNEHYPIAIDQFTRALARNPNDAALHGNLGIALARAGRSPEAISEFEECLLLDPGRIDIRKELAMALYRSERLKKAKENFETVVGQRPEDAEAYKWLFTINNQLDLKLENLPVLERLVELRPDYPEYIYAQVMIYHENDQVEEALRSFQSLSTTERESVKARYVLGSIYFKRQDYAKAIELLEQVANEDPANTQAAALLLSARKQSELALKYEQELADINESIEASPEDDELQFQHGLVLTKAGRSDDATEAFRKCLNLMDATDLDAVKQMAKQLYSLEQFELADQCLQMVAEEARDIEFYKLLLSFNSRHNQPLTNLPIIKKLAELQPEESQYAVWQLGIYLQHNKPEEAMQLMEKMPQEWQDETKNQYILGVTYYQLKKYPEAIEILEKVVVAQPDNEDAKKILDLCRSQSP